MCVSLKTNIASFKLLNSTVHIYIYIYIYIKSCTSKFMPQLKKQRISVFHNKYIKVQSLMGIKV